MSSSQPKPHPMQQQVHGGQQAQQQQQRIQHPMQQKKIVDFESFSLKKHNLSRHIIKFSKENIGLEQIRQMNKEQLENVKLKIIGSKAILKHKNFDKMVQEIQNDEQYFMQRQMFVTNNTGSPLLNSEALLGGSGVDSLNSTPSLTSSSFKNVKVPSFVFGDSSNLHTPSLGATSTNGQQLALTDTVGCDMIQEFLLMVKEQNR